MSLLSLRGVDVAYGDLPALTGVDLVIEPGEILPVVGATTLVAEDLGVITRDVVALRRAPTRAATLVASNTPQHDSSTVTAMASLYASLA